MMPTGIEIWFFLPVVLAAYWLAPRRATVQNGILVVASYLFFATWSVRLLPVLIVATAVDFLLARFIDDNRARPRAMRVALTISIVYNVLQLAYTKYAGFWVGSIVAPIGISFWTMSKLSYVIDVYYERIRACRRPIDFAAYVAFFPQLIAGPIVRGDEMLGQYAEPRRLDPEKVRAGGGALLLGVLMKAMVADWLAVAILDPAWADIATYSRGGHWIVLTLYAVHLFCDFAGYSLMAIGMGRLFGLELPQNFNYPYLATNPIDVWRRWHMSLNRWFFDYIYGPLTTGEGFFRGKIRAAFVVVFLISGIWHGARWTYLCWGLAHGLWLVAWQSYDIYYRSLCRKDRVWVARRKHPLYLMTAWGVTQLFFVLTLIPFRSPSLTATWDFLVGLVIPRGHARFTDYHLVALRRETVVILFAFFVGYHLLELKRLQKVREVFFKAPAVVRGVCYGLVIVFLLLFMPISASAFVYGAF